MEFQLEDCGNGLSFAQSQGTRESQQDDFGFLMHEDFVFLVIADGMGGHHGGQEASGLIVESFLSLVDQEDSLAKLTTIDLHTALGKANKSIANYVEQNPDKQGMGATVVCFLKRRSSAQWISVGDSHLYKFSKQKLEKLNADHSMMPMILNLVANKKLSPSDVDIHPLRHTLRSSVVGGIIELVDAPESPLEVEDNDVFVLCTDGVDTLSQQELTNILTDNSAQTSMDICRLVMQNIVSKSHCDQDNTSIAVFKAER